MGDSDADVRLVHYQVTPVTAWQLHPVWRVKVGRWSKLFVAANSDEAMRKFFRFIGSA